MAPSFHYISYSETGYFSKLSSDYADRPDVLKPFYRFTPDAAGIGQAISERKFSRENREILVDTLIQQYNHVEKTEKVEANIRLLADENTFTVTTAHQPNLLTGYLYFIYKILHAIKLSEHLKQSYKDKRFVPVYYMGSEDNDIDELGVFRFRGDKYVWDGDGQSGAVGRMNTKSLKPIIDNLFRVFGPPGKNCDELKEIIANAYNGKKNITQATQYIVNELFGSYGLVVLNPDDRALKASFTDVMKDDLLNNTAYPIVKAQSELLEKDYKSQAFPRPVNLFYLDEQTRERIEKHDEKWVVLNTEKVFTEQEIVSELNTAPEKFSPNVVLRGLFQETILPNVAFIGGGAEVAYWMQLKPVFERYNVFFPPVLLRQSVLWIDEKASNRLEIAGLTVVDIFRKELDLLDTFVKDNSTGNWHTNGEVTQLQEILHQLKEKATAIDSTLEASAEATLAKIKRQVVLLEKKMFRAEKRKLNTELMRIAAIKKQLFPNGSLQERHDNFMEYYLQYGSAFFAAIKEGIVPVNGNFLVVQE